MELNSAHISTGNSKISAAIIDIDGVLCRVDYTDNPREFNWTTFKELDRDRTILWEGVHLAKLLRDSGLSLVFITARKEFMREQTIELLYKVGLEGLLVMDESSYDIHHPWLSYRQAQALAKRDAVEELSSKYAFRYAVDDQQDNCDVYADFGIPTLKVMFTS